MKELLFRSFFIQKKIIGFAIAFMSIWMLLGSVLLNNNGLFLRIIPSLVFLSVSHLDQLDESAGYTKVLNSLPTSRKDIVNAKYLTALFLYFISLIVSLGFYYGFLRIGLISDYGINLFGGLIVSFVLSGILVAISIPVTIMLSFSKSKMINIILFMLVFNFANVTSTSSTTTLPNGVEYATVLFIPVMLFFSRVISINAYLKKDF